MTANHIVVSFHAKFGVWVVGDNYSNVSERESSKLLKSNYPIIQPHRVSKLRSNGSIATQFIMRDGN